MKRQIKKIALLIIAILGVNSVNAQIDFSIHLGMLLPQGDYALSNMNKGKVVWMSETSRAGAGLGFDAGVKIRYGIPFVKGLGVFATADFFLNTPNKDVKNWKYDYIESYNNSNTISKIEISSFNYMNIPIMIGANYEYEIDDNVKIWGEGALGINIGIFPTRKITHFLYTGMWDTEMSVHTNRNPASFAFQFGAGVMFKDRYSLGVHYYSLGTQEYKLTGHPETDFVDIHPSMFTIRLGYHF